MNSAGTRRSARERGFRAGLARFGSDTLAVGLALLLAPFAQAQFDSYPAPSYTNPPQYTAGGVWRYGSHFNPQTGQYESGYYFDPAPDRSEPGHTFSSSSAPPGAYRYSFTQRLDGTIEDLDHLQIRGDRPHSVGLVIRTTGGQHRTVHLGPPPRAELSELRRGDPILASGYMVEVDGRPVLKAEQIFNQAAAADRPLRDFGRVLRGELIGFQSVRTTGREVLAVVATIATDRGGYADVLIGAPEDARAGGFVLWPGAQVTLDGFDRMLDGRTLFVVRDLDVLGTAPRYAAAPEPLPESQTIRGTITEVRTEQMHGESRQIAYVSTDTGRTLRVDLGPRSRADLKAGDFVTATGQRFAARDGDVFVARYIEVERPVAYAERPILSPAPSVPQPVAVPSTGMFSGQITRLRDDVKYHGFKHKHVLADMRLDDGRIVRVDLGREDDVDDLELDEGDFVTFSATSARINGHSALVAHEVRANGERAFVRQSGTDRTQDDDD